MAALLAACGAAHAESYFCTTTMQAGLTYDKATKQWSSARFVAKAKLVLRRPNADEDKLSGTPKPLWIVVKHGANDLIPAAWCPKDFDEDNLYCQGIGTEFKFNRKKLRFLTTYEVGYWSWIEGISKEGEDTPAIGGGPCSRID